MMKSMQLFTADREQAGWLTTVLTLARVSSLGSAASMKGALMNSISAVTVVKNNHT